MYRPAHSDCSRIKVHISPFHGADFSYSYAGVQADQQTKIVAVGMSSEIFKHTLLLAHRQDIQPWLHPWGGESDLYDPMFDPAVFFTVLDNHLQDNQHSFDGRHIQSIF